MPDEPQRFCLGIAYMPGRNPQITKGADGGRDYLTEAELEKAAWSYLRSGPHVNAFHVPGTEGCATVVESSIHRGPDWDLGDGIVVTKGTWLVGAILDAPMWQAALDGKVNGWSPEGTARRRKVRKEEAVPIAKSALPAEGDEEFTELVDADFPTMGLVGKGANGVPRWLVMKDADGEATGLLDPGFIRDLIAKAEPEPSGRERVEMPNGITLNGSPADIAAFIHKASVRQAGEDVAKAEMSAKGQNDLPDSAFAYIESGGKKDESGRTSPRSLRHFPVHDAAHTRNALSRAPQSPFGDKAMPKIRAAAKKFGIEVSKEAGVTDQVAKDAGIGLDDLDGLDDGIDGMDPTVPLAAPEDDVPGDPTDPGSPAWEAIDAATAQKWLCIAARLKNALCLLAEREMLEAASADPDDAENAWDLQDAECAMDYVIGQIAVFAAGEQAEAELGAEAMAAIGKAMAAFDTAPLDAIEGLCAVAKSGRVLSAANEERIRTAAASLTEVLSSLPKAPVTDDGQPVAKQKGTTVAETQTAPETSAETVAKETAGAEATPKGGPSGALSGDVPGREILKAALLGIYDQHGTLTGVASPDAVLQRVAKADDGADAKTTMQAVFDENGNLVGIVDPADITPVAGAGGKPDADSADDTEAAPAADDGDLTPQPPADAGTPADAVDDDGTVTKQDQDAGTRDVLKSIVKEALGEIIGAQPPQEDIAKQADVAAAVQRLDDLTARLETVEKQDALPRVFSNGAVPPPGSVPAQPALRGQDQGAAQRIDVAKAREMKQRMYSADPAEANRIRDELNRSAIATLDAIHGRS